MPEYLVPLLISAAGFLLLDFLFSVLNRQVRRLMVYSRKHCIFGHSWGRRFGPFDAGGSHHYWGWKCARCPAVCTKVVYYWDVAAVKEYERLQVLDARS